MFQATHHGIVYYANRPHTEDELTDIVSKETLVGGFSGVNEDLFKQCNGSILILGSAGMFCFIPVDYVKSEEEVTQWINSCNEMGFNIKYFGKKPMEFIKHGYADNLKDRLYNRYHKAMDPNMYVCYIKETTNNYRLATFSMLRTLYIRYYRPIITAYYELLEKYPNENKFELLQMAFYIQSELKDYINECNGSYHLICFSNGELFAKRNGIISHDKFKERCKINGINYAFFNMFFSEEYKEACKTTENTYAYIKKKYDEREIFRSDFMKAINLKDFHTIKTILSL